MKSIEESFDNLKKELIKSGLKLNEVELQKIWLLHQLLQEKNNSHDLTRIDGFYNIIYKHYIDSLKVTQLVSPEGLTMDLGTGAGFPGLPIAIVKPKWPLLLAEPRSKRLEFMEEVAVKLQLDNVSFYPHKVNDYFSRPINNIITRDFESIAATLSRALKILPKDGEVYCMKGPAANIELEQAMKLPFIKEFELKSDHSYSLGDSNIKRRLLTFKKKYGSKMKNSSSQKIIEIASRENPRFKTWTKMLTGKGIKKHGEAIVSGSKIIPELLKLRPELITGMISPNEKLAENYLLPPQCPLYLMRSELYAELDIFGSKEVLLIVKTTDIPQWSGELTSKVSVFLPFQDPANLGAAIRSSAALGADIVLLTEAANPYHPKSLRAAGTAVFLANIFLGPSLKDLSETQNLYALSPKGENIFEFTPPPKLGLVAGIEGPGLDDLWPNNKRLSIPMEPEIESLNAATSVALALGLVNNFYYQKNK